MWKKVVIGAVVVAAVVFGVWRFTQMKTRQLSPEETVTFYMDAPSGPQVEITYCRPSKRGREIFGGLVPYGKVWRTGANEATTFTVNEDITFGGTPVKAGTYTLWTLPGPDTWVVYLNSKAYPWGVDIDGNAQRDPAFDAAAISVPVQRMNTFLEQFRISVEVESDPVTLTLAWDSTMVAVPIRY
ncbi:MAG: DUF2911 domain-containing protein [Flavobacteriales bacterium]|nr:DUF2911 domain-containing protein [Flavobacteriales bacterium]